MRNTYRIAIVIVGIIFLCLGIMLGSWQSIFSGLGLMVVVRIDTMGDGK